MESPSSSSSSPPMGTHDDADALGGSPMDDVASRPQTGLSSRAGDFDAGEPPPPSPSSASQSDGPDLDGYSDVTASGEPSTSRMTDAVMRSRDASMGLVHTSMSKPHDLVPQSPTKSSRSSQPGQPLNTDPSSPANLPPEILLHIFKFLLTRTTGHSHLRNCLLVCHSWCLSGVELLWHRPAFFHISSVLKLIHTMNAKEQTFPYNNFVRRLNFSGVAPDLGDELFSFMSFCTRLERLAVGDCHKLTDDTLARVTESLKNLVSIDLTNVKSVTDKTLETMARNCKRLQGINLTDCKEVTSKGVAALGENCRLLRRVKLCGCDKVTDDGILPLVINCPLLLEIDLYNCSRVSDKSVRQVWTSSNHVREVRLANCGPLTDRAFPAPARHYSSTNTAALDLGHSARTLLHSEHLSGSAHGSESAPTSRGGSPNGSRGDQAGQSPAQPKEYTNTIPMTLPLRPPKSFEHLRILDLTACTTMSDEAIEGIIATAPRIRNLVLSKCSRLTDEAIFSIAKLKKNLQYLHLGHVSSITDRSVIHLVNHCTRLRYFDLACCIQLTDLSVTELAAKLPKLKRIGLVRVTQITDAALYALVERHLTLQRVHLSYCMNISVAAVFWLLERLPKVTHISLTGVPAFRRPELQAMCRPPPEEFNDHQREAFCVFSGQGVVDLQRYLRGVYMSEESAANFGDLTPEVYRAIQLVQDHAHRRHHHSHRGDLSRVLKFERPPHVGSFPVFDDLPVPFGPSSAPVRASDMRANESGAAMDSWRGHWLGQGALSAVPVGPDGYTSTPASQHHAMPPMTVLGVSAQHPAAMYANGQSATVMHGGDGLMTPQQDWPNRSSFADASAPQFHGQGQQNASMLNPSSSHATYQPYINQRQPVPIGQPISRRGLYYNLSEEPRASREPMAEVPFESTTDGLSPWPDVLAFRAQRRPRPDQGSTVMNEDDVRPPAADWVPTVAEELNPYLRQRYITQQEYALQLQARQRRLLGQMRVTDPSAAPGDPTMPAASAAPVVSNAPALPVPPVTSFSNAAAGAPMDLSTPRGVYPVGVEMDFSSSSGPRSTDVRHPAATASEAVAGPIGEQRARDLRQERRISSAASSSGSEGGTPVHRRGAARGQRDGGRGESDSD